MRSSTSLQKSKPAAAHGSNGILRIPVSDLKRAWDESAIGPNTNKESIAHELIARVEARSNPIPKTIRAGTDERHAKRGHFSLQVTMDHEPSVYVADFISHVPDGKLASEIASKVDPTLMIKVLRVIDPCSFSMNFTVMHSAREHVYEVLGLYADAIRANLWATKNPTLDTILESVRAKKRIVHLFSNENELEVLEDRLMAATHCPGFLPIEVSENVLRKATAREKLTFERVTRIQVEEVRGKESSTVTLFSYLQRKGTELFKQRQEEIEHDGYLSLPMSTERIGTRVLNDPGRFATPHSIVGFNNTLTADSIIYKRSNVEFFRSTIVLFPPLGMEVAEAPDSKLVVVRSTTGGNGASFVGLSGEEQEFLRPLYQERLERMSIGEKLKRREKRSAMLDTMQYSDSPEAIGPGIRGV